MERVVSRVSTVVAIGLAVGLSLASGATLMARQDPAAKPAPPKDDLLLAKGGPHLIVWATKPGKGPDFEAAWAMIREQFAKSERPEVKEFAATIANYYKVDTGADGPAIYVFEIKDASKTQSYNPGRIIYEFLYKLENGKELGIPRADADAIFAKIGNLADMFASIVAWPLNKIGS